MSTLVKLIIFVVAAIVGLLITGSIRTPNGGMGHTLRTFLTLQRTSGADKNLAKRGSVPDAAPDNVASQSATITPTIVVRKPTPATRPTIIVRAITPTPSTTQLRPSVTPVVTKTPQPTPTTSTGIVQLKPITVPKTLATQTTPTVPQAGRSGGVPYVVGCGETVTSISQNIYGTIKYISEIMAANKDVADPNTPLECDLELLLP